MFARWQQRQLPFLSPMIARRETRAASGTPERPVVSTGGGPDSGKADFSVPKDKRILATMGEYAFDFLECLDYEPRLTSSEELTSTPPSATKFIAIIKFLSHYFVGNSFFSEQAKQDEDMTSVLELAKILKYPGPLHRSHLKTPGLPTVWSFCLTFLCWLVSLADKVIAPSTNVKRSPKKDPAIYSNSRVEDVKFKTLAKLAQLELNGQLTNAITCEELEEFKANICESEEFDRCITGTMEEYEEERVQLLSQLQQLINTKDPCQKIREQLEAEKDAQNSIRTEIQGYEKKREYYGNVNHLNIQMEGIKIEMDAKTVELERVKQLVSHQTVGKQKASEVSKEIDSLENQLISIRQINENLAKELKLRLQKCEESQQEFYELCKAFSVVESFNENVRILNLEKYSITSNPLSPEDMKNWMMDVVSNIKTARARAGSIAEEITSVSKQREYNKNEYAIHLEELKKEFNGWKLKLQSADKYLNFMAKNHEERRTELEEELDEERAKLYYETELLNRGTQALESAEKCLSEWNKSVVEHEATLDYGSHKLDEEIANFILYRAELNQFLHEFIINAATSQQTFYLTYFGFDIFEGLDP